MYYRKDISTLSLYLVASTECDFNNLSTVSCTSEDNQTRCHINRNRECKVTEGITPEDQSTVLLDILVTLYPAHYIKSSSNEHLKEMGMFYLKKERYRDCMTVALAFERAYI